jgi:hypothetical protein
MTFDLVVNAKSAEEAMQRFTAALPALLLKHANVASTRLASYIQTEKLSGQVLNVGTGRLRATVRPIEAVEEGTSIVGGALAGGPETEVRSKLTGKESNYAAVQEYGGLSEYTILPVDAHVLAFEVDGQVVFARRVTHPPLPERSYMRTSLEEQREMIFGEFLAATKEASAEAGVA